MADTNSYTVDSFNRPTQLLSWSEKVANNHKWFKQTADYYISQSGMFQYGNDSATEMDQLYDVYNNEFPAHWFTHVTNPLAAKDPKHTKFPAKIRAVNILRTNIDQLVGEYYRRPFVYQVVNRGEDGYNRYTSKLQEALSKNLTEHFIAFFQQDALNRGIPINEIPQPDEIEMPWDIQKQHKLTYKDALAVDGQNWLARAVDEYKIHRKRREMFLDWLVGGCAYSYKNIEHGDLVYEKVAPQELDFDKSPHFSCVEDGEWAVRRQWYTVSDVIDRFYEDLKKEDILELDKRSMLLSVDTFYKHLRSVYGDVDRGKIPVYHVQFKARKKMKLRMAVSEDGSLYQEPVDEDYIPEEGEEVETIWGNEVYEIWRIGKDMYVNPRAVPVQRNAMNNFSSCKLSYNGAKYSPTARGVYSLVKQGVPFQSLYIIVTYQLEKTIAKNKGKIILMDKNAIPTTKGWDEERFFWYSEAHGWALVNRNQPGVDKSWNQYTVLDMSTFGDIKNLIELQNYLREQWDITLGFNQQRKGQTYASSQSGATSQAIFQSNLVTDLVFLGFEDFYETELAGLLDLSKFLNIDGVKGLYNGTMYDRELINIDPVAYCNSELGLLLSRSPQEMDKVNTMKQLLQPMLQNGATPSMIAEVVEANSMAQIRAALAKLEDIQARQAQEQQQAEAQAEEHADQRLAAIEAMKNELKIQLQEHEYRWKERLAVLEGQMDMESAALLSRDETTADVPDVGAIFDRYMETLKLTTDSRMKTMELAQKDRMQLRDLAQRTREMKSKEKIEDKKAKVALKNKVVGEK
jgi:hypothetical protein